MNNDELKHLNVDKVWELAQQHRSIDVSKLDAQTLIDYDGLETFNDSWDIFRPFRGLFAKAGSL